MAPEADRAPHPVLAGLGKASLRKRHLFYRSTTRPFIRLLWCHHKLEWMAKITVKLLKGILDGVWKAKYWASY